MTGEVHRSAVEAWLQTVLSPTGEIAIERERPWASILRVPLRDEMAWLKVCRPVQRFEAGLTATLAARWPDRIAQVLAHDALRGWLLTSDAGDPLERLDNPPELWLSLLPMYAELQIGERDRVPHHLAAGVPDLRLERLPALYEDLVASPLPLDAGEMDLLKDFAPQFAQLCRELADELPTDSIQHDDLHHRSVFAKGSSLRILDWGDASIGHPFFSLLVTFQFLEEQNGLLPSDPWFRRLRDAYLEPWGPGLEQAFEHAQRVGLVAHALTWFRHRRAMPVGAWPPFDRAFPELLRTVLRRAVSQGG